MTYSISKKSKSPDMDYLIDEFESPVEYNFPSPPKSKPKSVNNCCLLGDCDPNTNDICFSSLNML